MPGMRWERSQASISDRGDKRAFVGDIDTCAKAPGPGEERVQSV